MRSHAIKIGVVAAVASMALWGGSGIASAGGGCMHSTGPTTGRGNTVDLSDMCFTSTVLYVEPGTTSRGRTETTRWVTTSWASVARGAIRT